MKKIYLLAAVLGVVLFSHAQTRTQVVPKAPMYSMTIDNYISGIDVLTPFFANMRLKMTSYTFPDTTGIVYEVYQKLDTLERWMKALSPKLRGLTIDVIGQTHYNPGIENNIPISLEVTESQSHIKDILSYNKYQLIGREGSSIIESKQTIFGYDHGQRKRYGITRFNSLANANYAGKIEMMAYDALFSMIANDNEAITQAKVVGFEDSTIHYLNMITLGCGSPDCNEYYCLNAMVISLRSYIAFFKIAEEMLKTGKTDKSSIIIGSAHLKDFPLIAQYAGVKINVYETSRR